MIFIMMTIVNDDNDEDNDNCSGEDGNKGCYTDSVFSVDNCLFISVDTSISKLQ